MSTSPLKALANPGAVVFGATLLHDGVDRNFMARKVMERNNARGIFDNTDDDLDGLEWALSEHFADSTVEVVGCVGISPGDTWRQGTLRSVSKCDAGSRSAGP